MRRRIDVKKLTANPLDRAINYFAPEWASRRMRARAQNEIFMSYGGGGGYDAARVGNRAVADLHMRARDGSADAAIVRDLSKLRAASSDLVRNSGVARSAIDQLCNKSISTGLTPQSHPLHDVLGVTEEIAREKSKLMETLFWAWRARADFYRRFDFATLERIMLYSTFEMGDAFAAKVYDTNPGDIFSFKLQMVEAARVSNPDYKPDTATLVQGIEHDDRGRPYAVWFCNTYPQERFTANVKKIEWTKYKIFGESGRRNIIHTMLPTRIGQSRGVPILATVIATLEQLTTFTQAELMAAVINSCFALTMKSDEDASPAGASSGSIDRLNVDLRSGTILETSLHEKIESFTPGRPSASFEPFWEAMTNEIGSAVGVSGAVLRRSFKASYSASRAELLETYESCLIYKRQIESMFHQECWDEVMFESVLRGYIDLPGWQDPLTWAAWMNVDWIGPALPSLDPLKEAKAAEILIANNLSTQAAQTTRLTRGDWQDNVAQRHREIAEFPPVPEPGQRSAPPQDGEDEDGAEDGKEDETEDETRRMS